MGRRSLEETISNDNSARIRGKMGVDKGNKYIQDTYNRENGTKHVGFNKD